MAFINVRDSGTAQVATNVVSYAGDTVETQIINICDPVTPANQLGIDSSGRARVKPVFADTFLSPGAVSVGVAATLIATTTSTRVKITIQNFSTAATNEVVYLGGSTVTTSTGIALLDGNSRTFENTGAIYGIASITTSVRLLVETGS